MPELYIGWEAFADLANFSESNIFIQANLPHVVSLVFWDLWREEVAGSQSKMNVLLAVVWLRSMGRWG